MMDLETIMQSEVRRKRETNTIYQNGIVELICKTEIKIIWCRKQTWTIKERGRNRGDWEIGTDLAIH